MTPTAAQIRAGRALLGWSQADLATAAKVHVNAVRGFEGGRRDPRRSTLAALVSALARAGVTLSWQDGGQVEVVARRMDSQTNTG